MTWAPHWELLNLALKSLLGLTAVSFVHTYCSLCFLWGGGSVSYVPGRTQTHRVVQAGFEPVILCFSLFGARDNRVCTATLGSMRSFSAREGEGPNSMFLTESKLEVYRAMGNPVTFWSLRSVQIICSVILFTIGLGMEAGALCLLGRSFLTELQPSPLSWDDNLCMCVGDLHLYHCTLWRSEGNFHESVFSFHL